MDSYALEMRGVAKKYCGFTLGPLDFAVPPGAIYGLIGPNGAGKTTAIDMIFGMGAADSGEIRVFGLDNRRDSVSIKSRAAYVGPDLDFAVWKTVGRALRFVRGFYPDWDDAYCGQLVQSFGLSPGDRIASLSFGAKTKLSLVTALSHHPEILILDEPTTGLDAISKQLMFSELLKAVENGDRTVLISSHGLADIERYADHVGMLHRGRLLLDGRTDQVVDRYCLADIVGARAQTLENRRGLTVLDRREARCRALINKETEVPDWLKAQYGADATFTRLTLEELFLMLARDEAKP